MAFDTRLIQTAVLGGPDSYEPVICPEDPIELDVFKEEMQGVTFWCSPLLGGCGRQLGTRRCVTRASHFFHLHDPEGVQSDCSRRARGGGIGSADHLFIKSAMQRMFHRQGLEPRYRFVSHDDAPVGSVVDIELNGHKLRVHMNKDVPIDWEAVGAGALILGPGVQISDDLLQVLRYVNRVKFKSEGRRRIMVIGTQVAGEATTWGIDPSDCRIAEDGWLVTPVVERIWNAEGHDPARLQDAFRRVAGETASDASRQIGELIRLIKMDMHAGLTGSVQSLCEQAEQEISRCSGAALSRLNAVLAEAHDWLNGQDRDRQRLFNRLGKAQRNRDVTQTRALVARAEKLLKRGTPPSQAEQDILAAAKRMISTPAPVPTPRPPIPPLTINVPPQPQPELQPPVARPRQKQRAEREDLTKAKEIIVRLRSRRLSDKERLDILTRLVSLEETVGHRFSVRERHDIQRWKRKFPSLRGSAAVPAVTDSDATGGSAETE
ncbi:hypothetical protein [Streptomyces blattellae]|uniref:hypothetical protein n=1 Tax=Streptomyces blattellae TaxID=2569855 RepID=UPI0012B72B34|nr:hypothetical protein [Streptomyces blattellae]